MIAGDVTARPLIRGVLFDKDGTLIDYQASWAPTNLSAGRLASSPFQSGIVLHGAGPLAGPGPELSSASLQMTLLSELSWKIDVGLAVADAGRRGQWSTTPARSSAARSCTWSA